jgi:hypothetical protein
MGNEKSIACLKLDINEEIIYNTTGLKIVLLMKYKKKPRKKKPTARTKIRVFKTETPSPLEVLSLNGHYHDVLCKLNRLIVKKIKPALVITEHEIYEPFGRAEQTITHAKKPENFYRLIVIEGTLHVLEKGVKDIGQFTDVAVAMKKLPGLLKLLK